MADENIAKKSISALDLSGEDTILEIGPGRGILTKLLLEKAKRVVAVEIDPSLCSFLQERFKSCQNFILIQRDFLQFSLDENDLSGGKKIKVIGNLPYAVVSPILQKILDWNHWSIFVALVQKEVGERILAREGSKKYGILSLSVQSRSSVEKAGTVSRFCFRPVPRVESMLLRFFPEKVPFSSKREEELFFNVVRSAFSHRRKTILNSFSYSSNLSLEQIKGALKSCGFSASMRAESFSLSDFLLLSKMLYDSEDGKAASK